MDQTRVGAALLALGLVIAGIGTVGAVASSGTSPSATPTPASTPTATASVVPTVTATPAPTPAPTRVPTPAPTPTPDPEALIRAFYEVFVPALRATDVESLVATLHPATLQRYGEAACRDALGRLDDPSFDVAVRAVSGPGPWDYTLDGVTTTIADAWTVEADVTALGTTTARELHVAVVDGTVRWFTDCGDPL